MPNMRQHRTATLKKEIFPCDGARRFQNHPGARRTETADGGEIAAELETSKATRYIAKSQRDGQRVPIAGKPAGAYILEKGFDLPP